MTTVEVLATWLWQGIVVAPGVSAATRYAIWWTAMLGVLLIPLIGVATRAAASAPDGSPDGSGVPGPTSLSAAPSVTPVVLPSPAPSVEPGLAWLWFALVVVGLGRLGRDLYQLRRWKARARPMSAERERGLSLWRAMKTRGRGVRLAITDDAPVASALGFRSPAILVPRTSLRP